MHRKRIAVLIGAPGNGLGLALSRRLARDISGDLAYDDHITDGPCFVLKLPLNPI